MKGVFRFTMMTVSLLGAMASCSDMEVAEVNGRYPEVITATIAEPDGQAQSRTCVDMSDTGNGYLGLLVTRNFAASLFRNIKYFTLRKLYLCRKWMQKRLQKTTTTGITLPNFDFLA